MSFTPSFGNPHPFSQRVAENQLFGRTKDIAELEEHRAQLEEEIDSLQQQAAELERDLHVLEQQEKEFLEEHPELQTELQTECNLDDTNILPKDRKGAPLPFEVQLV